VQLVLQAAALRVVLAAGAPHQRVLELLEQRLVDLVAEGLDRGAAAVLRRLDAGGRVFGVF
jgi:hypothetical protein